MTKDRVLQSMIGRVPEQRLWRELQEVVADGRELDDTTVARLDSQMQGFLFLQYHVSNRRARITSRSRPRSASMRARSAGRMLTPALSGRGTRSRWSPP